ncbi:MAG: hypothetical protein AAF715_13455 [Myxococcota bacterium]
MNALRLISSFSLATILSLSAVGCGLEEVEDTVVPACENLRAECSTCCQDEGFDRGAYEISDERCNCKTVLDD